MRCPQCGNITLAATQTRGVATAYCEDCAQWWEWVSRSSPAVRSGRQGRMGGRWIVRVAVERRADGPDRSRPLLWRGRLLQESETSSRQPVSAGA
jgi:hypothetical protein